MAGGESERLLRQGRAAVARSDWQAALDAFIAADVQSPLGVEDLEQAALAAMWLFQSDLHIDLMQRAFGIHVAAGDARRALADLSGLGVEVLETRVT
jgi:hypothetical protein